MSSPFIWNGLFAKSLVSFLNLNATVYVLQGTADPSSVAQNAPQGSIYFRTGASGGHAYLKQDAGSSTNWTIIPLSSGYTTVHVTGTSQAISAGNAYLADNASVVTLTLPVTAALGDRFQVIGVGTGGWKIAQNASQYIVKDVTSSTTGVVGFLESGQYRSCVEIVCTVANTEFEVVDSQGVSMVNTVVFQGSTATYVAGGYGGSAINQYQKLLLSGETTSALAATLSSARAMEAGFGSPTKGYTEGGGTSNQGTTGIDTVINALTFSGETNATLTAVLAAARFASASADNVATKGYAMGGANSSVLITTISALSYSGETFSDLAAVLTTATGDGSGMTYGSSKGFTLGGANSGAASTIGDGSGASITTIQSINFSGDTFSAVAATLPAIRSGYGSTAACSDTIGYLSGGFNQSASQSTIYKLTFSGETTSTAGISLSTGKRECCATSSVTKGYVEGGRNTSGTYVTTIEAITFAGETIATLGATLVSATSAAPGFQI